MCRSIDGAKVRHFRRGNKFSGPKTGVFFKTYAVFLVACFWDLFFGPGTAEQGTDNSGTEIKVPEESAQDFI